MMRPMSLGGRSLWGEGPPPPPPPPVMAAMAPQVASKTAKKKTLAQIAEEKDKRAAVEYLRDLVEELEGDSDDDSDDD